MQIFESVKRDSLLGLLETAGTTSSICCFGSKPSMPCWFLQIVIPIHNRTSEMVFCGKIERTLRVCVFAGQTLWATRRIPSRYAEHAHECGLGLASPLVLIRRVMNSAQCDIEQVQTGAKFAHRRCCWKVFRGASGAGWPATAGGGGMGSETQRWGIRRSTLKYCG